MISPDALNRRLAWTGYPVGHHVASCKSCCVPPPPPHTPLTPPPPGTKSNTYWPVAVPVTQESSNILEVAMYANHGTEINLICYSMSKLEKIVSSQLLL